MTDIFLTKRPHVTEKALALQGGGKYVFIVKPTATKPEVKKWVSEKYRVRVVSVNIVSAHNKPRRFRNIRGVKAGEKKAIVTLRAGDKIEAT